MKSRILFIVLSAVALSGCSCGSSAYGQQESYSFVQYNVGVFDKSDSTNVKYVADLVKLMNADVITLNEVDSCALRTGKVDQMAEFAEAMGGWNCYYASAMPFNGGAYGIGIASRPELEILKTDKVPLPKGDGYEPRVMAVVEFKDFVMAATHLDLTPDSRQEQVNVINEYFDSKYADVKKPIFLAGDFNATPDSELMIQMKESWSRLSSEEFTYPSHAPDRCIDYIYVRAGRHSVKAQPDSQLLPNVALSYASDHLPVKVTAVWR